ncbi:cytochrome c [Ornithobacterium rhinotracheale]|uniref:cytochrome c n=1 Tax=Ornithobacterium rhinotracheale TaxID=28251 RepID=UPI001FF2CA88|nr:cytochrome c [Ornithobacterium rhinotracheale]MCK0205937.1 cytochrome c [Ornithobacterium rhinotracheale]
MFKKITPLIFVGLSIVSCSKKETPQSSESSESVVATKPEFPGEKYMKTQCYVCHHPTAPEANRAAPTLYEIKKVYLQPGVSEEQFVKEFVDFTHQPTQEAAKMKEAVKKYGLMPNNGFNREDVEAIAKYIYENDLPKPDWYQEDK